MPAKGDHLNSSHTLQISKLIVDTEGRELGSVLDSSAETAIQCATKRKMLGHLETILKILKYFNII